MLQKFLLDNESQFQIFSEILPHLVHKATLYSIQVNNFTPLKQKEHDDLTPPVLFCHPVDTHCSTLHPSNL